MDPRSGMVVALLGEDADPPAPGARLDVEDAIANETITFGDLKKAEIERLEEMAAKGESLVAVDEGVVQKLRLGERELRRRKERRRT